MKPAVNLTIITIASILSITILELYAISKGIDGLLLTGVIGVLAGVPTWFISRSRTLRKVNRGK